MPVRFVSLAWVLMFALTMVIPPFQVAADDKREDPAKGQYLDAAAKKGEGGKYLDVVGERQYDLEADHHFITQGNIEDIAARIKAGLVGEKLENIEGNWTFQVEGAEVDEAIKIVPDRGGKARADFSILHGPLTTGKAFNIHVIFEGRVNGERQTVQETYELKVPGTKATYDFNGGKNTVTGHLKQAKKAHGNWVIGLYDQDGDEITDREFTDVDGLSQSANFKSLKPGEYQGEVIFEGTVDGKKLTVWDYVRFTVTKDGGYLISDGKDGDPDHGSR